MKRPALAALLPTMFAFSGVASAQAESYTIDSSHTFPTFEILHLNLSVQRGRFNETQGSIRLDQKARTGSVELSIKAASVDTGLEALEKHLREEDFFNVQKYPTISYKSRAFKFDGDRPVAVEGDLTLLGVTKPVRLTVENFRCGDHPMAKRKACGALVSTTIKRSEFGMGKYPPPVLGDEVKISVSLEALKDQ
jgi:polyisoprenoid-binding protein YceI